MHSGRFSLVRWGGCALLFICCWAAAAEQFAIKKIWFEKKDAGYAARADLQVGQHELIDKILRSGYQAELNFEFYFMQRREWLFDRVAGDISWHGKLSYDSLTKRYVLIVGGRQRHFSDLAAAMQKISRLRAGANSDSGYVKIFLRDDIYLRARFYMSTDNLPLPIQVGLFVDGDLQIGSGWISLPLDVRE